MISETLQEQVGPYSDTVEALRAHVLDRARQRARDGWRLEAVDYRQERQPATGRWRYVADVRYSRTLQGVGVQDA